MYGLVSQLDFRLDGSMFARVRLGSFAALLVSLATKIMLSKAQSSLLHTVLFINLDFNEGLVSHWPLQPPRFVFRGSNPFSQSLVADVFFLPHDGLL